MKDVVFVRQQGGLARTAPGEDHVSAFISYGATVGEGTDTDPITGSVASLEGSIEDATTKRHSLITSIFSLKQAEDLGILPNDLKYNGTTVVKAVEAVEAVEAVAGVPANGDIPAIPEVKAVEAVEAEIGESPIGIHNIWHYHISEFFRINPTGQLWLGLFEKELDEDEDGGGIDTADGLDIDFSEILDVQRAALGKVRQAAVYTTNSFKSGFLGDIQAHADLLEIEHMPLSVLLGANVKSILSFNDDDTIINSATQKNVSVVIGQDAGNDGAILYIRNDVSITCLGATLGAVSRASVHESIAWVQEFNMASSELDTLALANGELISTLARTALDAIDNKGFIFLKKHIGISGSYFNDTHTGALPTSDFAFIENNRTLDKAIRGIRASLLPQLNSPLYVEANGNLSFDTIGYFESLASRSLEAMRIDGEVSNYDVFIDSEQNVLSNSELKIQISIIPVGVARTIEVSIGFTLSIA